MNKIRPLTMVSPPIDKIVLFLTMYPPNVEPNICEHNTAQEKREEELHCDHRHYIHITIHIYILLSLLLILYFFIGLNGWPPQMFISPHVALLAKSLDTPALGG